MLAPPQMTSCSDGAEDQLMKSITTAIFVLCNQSVGHFSQPVNKFNRNDRDINKTEIYLLALLCICYVLKVEVFAHVVRNISTQG